AGNNRRTNEPEPVVPRRPPAALSPEGDPVIGIRGRAYDRSVRGSASWTDAKVRRRETGRGGAARPRGPRQNGPAGAAWQRGRRRPAPLGDSLARPCGTARSPHPPGP